MKDELGAKGKGAETEHPEPLRECVGADFYSCEEAIKRLNEYLDHQLNDEERVVVIKHLEICKPCLSRFTFEQELIVSIRQKLCSMGMPQNLKDKLKGLLRKPVDE